METKNIDRQILRHLALVYIALAHATDEHLSDEEINTIARKLKAWESVQTETVLSALKEAMDDYVIEGAELRVKEAIKAVRHELSHEQRQSILDDLVSIAMADDRFIYKESSFIGELVKAWEVYPGGESGRPGSWSLLHQDGADRNWNLVHDVTLLYLAIAHHSDGRLTDAEMETIQKRLGEWLPQATEDEILEVVRQVMTTYAQDSVNREFSASVRSVKNALPAHQLSVLYGDLVSIAGADGRIQEVERSLIADLSKEWDVSLD